MAAPFYEPFPGAVHTALMSPCLGHSLLLILTLVPSETVPLWGAKQRAQALDCRGGRGRMKE